MKNIKKNCSKSVINKIMASTMACTSAFNTHVANALPGVHVNENHTPEIVNRINSFQNKLTNSKSDGILDSISKNNEENFDQIHKDIAALNKDENKRLGNLVETINDVNSGQINSIENLKTAVDEAKVAIVGSENATNLNDILNTINDTNSEQINSIENLKTAVDDARKLIVCGDPSNNTTVASLNDLKNALVTNTQYLPSIDKGTPYLKMLYDKLFGEEMVFEFSPPSGDTTHKVFDGHNRFDTLLVLLMKFNTFVNNKDVKVYPKSST